MIILLERGLNMKYVIEINDIDLLEKALDNAIAAYGDLCYSIMLGMGPQISFSKFAKLDYTPDGELNKHLEVLKDLFNQIKIG
jgi:hypothetical protein